MLEVPRLHHLGGMVLPQSEGNASRLPQSRVTLVGWQVVEQEDT